jgi:hypothetical protein
MKWKLLSNEVNVRQGLNWISQTFGPNDFKTKQGST